MIGAWRAGRDLPNREGFGAQHYAVHGLASGTTADDSSSLALHYEAVVERIAHRHHVRQTTARRWFAEMVRFLDLCADTDEPLAPSKKVDKAWHEFLLFTRAYAEFCEWRYQRFLHHDPADEPDPAAYKRTHLAYWNRYGQPYPSVWPIGGFFSCIGTSGCISSGCGSGCGASGCGGGG